MDAEKVLFLDVARFEDGRVLRGGALVTDLATEPIEFRCTTPVRPTKLQKILWGARLSAHVASHLLGMPLLRSLESDYVVVAVRDEDFFEVRGNIEIPVVRLLKHGELEFDVPGKSEDMDSIEAEGNSTSHQQIPDDDSALLESGSGRFEPVVISCHKGYRDDRKRARSILRPIFRTRDVLEPFERIQRALQAIHEEEKQEEAR